MKTSHARWPATIYRGLLTIYPKSFRDRFARPMTLAFLDRWAEERTFVRRWRFAVGSYANAIREGVAERARQRSNQDSTNHSQSKEWGWSMWHDARFALRFLRRAPGFTIVAVVTLALGIGANTAMFSLVYGILLRPLALTDPDRLMYVLERNPNGTLGRGGASPGTLEFWRQEATSFESLSGWFQTNGTLEIDQRSYEMQNTLLVSPNFFATIGASPVLGRVFVEADAVIGQAGQVMVISHHRWQTHWDGDSAIVGQRVLVDGRTVEIIGVMPDGVPVPTRGVDAWLTAGFDPTDRALTRLLITLGRLRPEVSITQAQQEMTQLAERWGQIESSSAGWGVHVESALDRVVGDIRPTIVIAFGAVSMVLLIACANLANMLLARATYRTREMALRKALGASRGRLIRQLVVESMVLASVGGLAGLLAARVLHATLVRMGGTVLPRMADVSLDGPILIFAAGVMIATGLLFGLVPAVHASRSDVHGALRVAGLGDLGGRRAHTLRSGLAVSQVALTVVLLAASGVLLRSLHALRNVDPGFDYQNTVAARMFLADRLFPSDSAVRTYYAGLVADIQALPSVTAAGATIGLPMDPVGIDFDSPYSPLDRVIERGQEPRADYRFVTAGYFKAMDMAIVEGRTLDPRDGLDGQGVVVINREMARRTWPDESPLGKQVYVYFGGRIPVEVVGVVNDIRFKGLGLAPRAEMYMPVNRFPFSTMTVVARGSIDAGTLMRDMQQAIVRYDSRQPPHSVVTIRSLVDDSLASERFYATLLSVFASVALLIAVVGVYGVITYNVAEDSRNISIRVALGAERLDVMKHVVKMALVTTAVGVALGTLGAVASGRFLRTMVFGVGPVDPLVLGVVVVGFLACGMVAGYVPARRVMRSDPLAALRHD